MLRTAALPLDDIRQLSSCCLNREHFCQQCNSFCKLAAMHHVSNCLKLGCVHSKARIVPAHASCIPGYM